MYRERRTVAFWFVVAVLTVGLVLMSGCGGGGSETTETTVPPDGTPAPTETTAPAISVPKAFGHLIGTPLALTEDSPEGVRAALERKTPMVVSFFVAGGTDDVMVMESLDELAVRYPEVEFLEFDFKNASAYGDLSALLEIDYPPQVTFIDGQGIITAVTSGYADEGTLNQNVANIR